MEIRGQWLCGGWLMSLSHCPCWIFLHCSFSGSLSVSVSDSGSAFSLSPALFLPVSVFLCHPGYLSASVSLFLSHSSSPSWVQLFHVPPKCHLLQPPHLSPSQEHCICAPSSDFCLLYSSFRSEFQCHRLLWGA